MVKFANFSRKQQNKERIQFSHFSLKRTANNNYFIHFAGQCDFDKVPTLHKVFNKLQ